MPSDAIPSPGTRRADRLPPGHTLAHDWPDATPGPVPPFDAATWDLALFPKPLLAEAKAVSWAAFAALPRVKVFADFHSAEGWSRLGNLWEGVATRELLNLIELAGPARFVTAHGEFGLFTTMPLDDFLAEDCLLATHHNGRPLDPEHGGPVRLVVPGRYGGASLKWVRGIEYMVAAPAGLPADAGPVRW